jgi:hypothetical protein
VEGGCPRAHTARTAFLSGVRFAFDAHETVDNED